MLLKFESTYTNFHLRKCIWKCLKNITISFKTQCVNSFWPSDAIWLHKTWATLVQVMAYCLKAPSHYLDQYWLIINKVLCIHLRVISQEGLKILGTSLKITTSRLKPNLPGANELRWLTQHVYNQVPCTKDTPFGRDPFEGDATSTTKSVHFIIRIIHLHKGENISMASGPRLNIKTVLSTYGDFHVKDKTAVRTSYL